MLNKAAASRFTSEIPYVIIIFTETFDEKGINIVCDFLNNLQGSTVPIIWMREYLLLMMSLNMYI